MAADISNTPVYLTGQEGAELLQGGAGDDVLQAFGGIDTLEGLGGNDRFPSNWEEAMVIRLGPGFGQDTLEGYSAVGATIEFQAGIDASQIQVSLRSVGFSEFAVLSVAGTSDALYLAHSNVSVKFADGTQWSNADFQSRLTSLVGTDQSDLISRQPVLQIVRGYQGNDTIVGGDVNKRLQGDEGDDLILQKRATQATLLGGVGNDRLEVEGHGNTLWGGAGQDTYAIGYNSSGSIIEVQGGEPVEDASDLVDLRASNLMDALDSGGLIGSARIDIVDGRRDLVISRQFYPNTADVLRVRNIDDSQLSALQFRLNYNSPFTLTELVSWAETGVLPDNIRPMQVLGTAEADVLGGGDGDDTLIGLAGADTLNSSRGNDLLIGGDGNDVLNLYGGHGVLVGGDGGDTYAVSSNGSIQADIVEAGAANTGLDVLTLTTHLSTTQVNAVGQDLVIQTADGSAQTTVKDFFATDPALHSGIDRYVIEDNPSRLKFILTPEAMARAAVGIAQSSELESDLMLGGAGGDDLQGGSHQATGFQDYISGGAGNDTIRSFSGAYIIGGEGDDAIEVLQFRGDTGSIAVGGGAGNDTITVTSDHLSGDVDVASVSGGAGSDLVVIKTERASVSTSYGAGDIDKVLMVGTMANGSALKASDVMVRRRSDAGYPSVDDQYELLWNDAAGQALGHVSLSASTDRMDSPLVTFTDGTFWTRKDLDRLATQGTAADDDLNGALYVNDLLIGGAGNDRLRGWGGNDTYDGGAGDDHIDLYGAYSSTDAVVRFGPGGGHDNVSLWSEAPVVLELDAGTRASDWSVSSAPPAAGYGYGYGQSQGSTTLTYKPSGETIEFNYRNPYWGSEASVKVRMGATGVSQSLFDFRNAVTVVLPPPPPPQPLLLQGTQADDALVGGALNDTLIGLDGNDTLTGGRGNDVIDVGMGEDVVSYALGDGDDTVVANDLGQGRLHLDGPFLLTDLSLKQQAEGGYRLSFGALPGSITFSGELDSAVPMILVSSGDSGGNLGLFGLDELLYLNPAVPDRSLKGTDVADTLTGSFGRDTLDAGAGADLLIGGSNNDIYRGGAGDDVIIDRPSANDPRSVSGVPMLRGGQDTYLFGRGDGVDTVIDTGPSSRDDILQFGDGITLADIELVRRSAVGALDARSPAISTALPQLDYEIYRIKGTADEIRFTADVPEVSPGPEWLRFADGTVVLASDLLAGAAAPIGMNISGTAQAEGRQGTTLADTLAGGLGNDTLNGAAGSDQYIFAVGDGIDLIQEVPQNAYSGDVDTLMLHGALSLDTLKFSRNIVAVDRFRPLTTLDGITNVHSLVYAYTDVIDLGAGAGQVQVSWQADPSTNMVSSSTEQNLGVLEQIKLDNGESLNGNEFLQRVLAGGVSLRGTNYAAALSGASGHDLVEAGSQADSLSGWAGNDTLRGNDGDDVLTGGLGNDLLVGGAGADTLIYDRGDGADTVVVDGSDTVRLGAGLSRSDVLIGKLGEKVANAVVLQFGKDSADSITLEQAGSWNGLQVRLIDGSVITGADIMAEATKPNDLTLQGSGNADSLKGGAGNDTLSGLAGSDTLLGAEGLDVLTGGLGNDVLDGGAGADTYKFSVGDGSDTIHADGLDTLALGAGLTKANVQIGKLGAKVANAVVLGLGSNAADTITLDNAGNWAGLQLKFADGSSLSGAEILLAATKPDNLTLTGTTKADVLTGKDGNDTLSGLAGNDTLAGGKGNDSLIGGKGNDTYLFNRGDGQDVIVDTDSTLFNSDLLKLGGATSKQLWLTRSGSNLDIQILGTADKVSVQGWFASSSNRVEKITASDGKSLSASKVNALVNAMASFTPPADGVNLPANTPATVTKLIASSWA